MSGALSSEPTAWLFGSCLWGDTQTSANNLFIRGFLAEDKTYLDGLRIRPDGYLGYFAENLLPCSVSRCLEARLRPPVARRLEAVSSVDLHLGLACHLAQSFVFGLCQRFEALGRGPLRGESGLHQLVLDGRIVQGLVDGSIEFGCDGWI